MLVERMRCESCNNHMLGDMHLRVAVATTVGDDQQGASEHLLSSSGFTPI